MTFFRGTDSTVLQSLLSFLYKGRAEVAEDQIGHFMALAEELGVEGLAKADQDIGDEGTSLYKSQRKDVIQQQEVKISPVPEGLKLRLSTITLKRFMMTTKERKSPRWMFKLLREIKMV